MTSEIPATARAWVLCDELWVEVPADRALDEVLESFDTSAVVSILFRLPNAPSPNTAPPSSASVVEPKYERQPCDMMPRPHNVVDPFTLEAIDTLPSSNLILVHDADASLVYLVCASDLLESLKQQFNKGADVFSLHVDATCGDKLTSIQTSMYVWGRLISRSNCPRADDFRDFLLTALVLQPAYKAELQSLSTDLRLRIQFLVHDLLELRDGDRFVYDLLRHKSEIPEVYANLYMSSLYFSEEEMRRIANFPTPNGDTFQELVHSTVESKFESDSSVKSTTGAHVCSAHDVAPLYRTVFQLSGLQGHVL